MAVALRPAQVHAHEHSSPIAGLGTACSRRYLQHGTHLVFFAAEHVSELQGAQLRLKLSNCRVYLRLFNHAFAVKLYRGLDFTKLRLNGLVARNPVLDFANLAHGQFGLLGVIPKIRIAGFLLFVGGSNPLFFEAQVAF